MFDAFMKFDGIKGESLDAKHKGEIDVVKFNWAAAQNSSWATGGGGGSGKASVQDFQFTHQYDLASPLLFKYCVTGTHIKEANFTVRRVSSADSGVPDFLKIKFTDILISRVNPHGNTEQHEGILGEKGSYGSPIGTTIVGSYDATDASLAHTYGDELPLEEVSISFAKVEITYQPLDPGGRPNGGPTVVTWDIKGNTGPGTTAALSTK